MLAITLIFTFSNCDKIRNLRTTELIETVAPLRQDTCYVVAYNICGGVEIQDSTAKANAYVFISEDLKDTLYASYRSSPLIVDSLNNFFDFPAEIMPRHAPLGPRYYCGPNPFPEEYRFAYKVLITYRPMTEEEFSNGGALFYCFYMYAWEYVWRNPAFIVILSITKI